MSYNKVILIGNAGKDPEIRHLDSGVAVITLPVVTSERIKDRNGEWREMSEWHNVVFWRALAESVEKYVRKGSQILVEGKLRSRSWEDQNGQKRYTTEVVAETLKVLTRRDNNNPQQNGQQDIKPHIANVPDITAKDTVDDLPF
ncbi:MAG: single-stranded DNA-binding protein [Prevotellaceae bacterium]|jgi:single-strand DNA-binding protein|nr:single-stranded DNA-binding protein [Prevotellaceae bacterium]